MKLTIHLTCSVILLAVIAVSVQQRVCAQVVPNPSGVDMFAICVNDGMCAASPAACPMCAPGSVPGQPCQTCATPRTRQACVFSSTQQCAWTNLIGKTGCGAESVGCCLGGAGATPCVLPIGTGLVCDRIICTSGPML